MEGEDLLAEDITTIDPSKDYLKELVGDGKKFKTVEDLARGKYEADQFIETLKLRQDEIRADYLKVIEENKARAKLEELIDQMQNSQKNTNSDTTQKAADNQTAPQIDPKKIEDLISSKFQEHELTKKQQENYNLMKEKLVEHYGGNYQSAVKEQIDNLGLTVEEFNSLAKKNPTLLFKSLGLDQPRTDPFQTPPRSSQRNDSFTPRGQPKRTWSYYQELKKSNPNLYYDPKIANQMHDDRIALGDAFKDGDYSRYGD